MQSLHLPLQPTCLFSCAGCAAVPDAGGTGVPSYALQEAQLLQDAPGRHNHFDRPWCHLHNTRVSINIVTKSRPSYKWPVIMRRSVLTWTERLSLLLIFLIAVPMHK